MRQVLTVLALISMVMLIVFTIVTRRVDHTPPTVTGLADVVSQGPDTIRDELAVIGTVAPSSPHQLGASEWQFTLQDGDASVLVHYQGDVPSTFDDGARVMVVGAVRDAVLVARSVAVAAPM